MTTIQIQNKEIKIVHENGHNQIYFQGKKISFLYNEICPIGTMNHECHAVSLMTVTDDEEKLILDTADQVYAEWKKQNPTETEYQMTKRTGVCQRCGSHDGIICECRSSNDEDIDDFPETEEQYAGMGY